MEGQSYVCTLLKEELVFCVCLKSSNSMIVLHPQLLWRGCYRATRRNILKPRTNLGVWLKHIQCKSCSAIAKLIALLFMYLRQLLDTHTHTQFVLKKCTIKWPYMLLNMTIASQNLEGWTIITHTHTLLAKKPTSHKIDWSGSTHQSMRVLSLLIIKNQAWEFTQPFYFFPYIFICTFIYNTCHYDLTLNNS
jgi:hypothetical protein